MTTFDPSLIATYPQVAESDVKLLWHGDYWDGLIDGMLLHQGEKCWYERIAENANDDDQWYRRFVIVRLTPEQLADALLWHEMFQTHVGTHTDYDDPCGSVRPREGMHLFYDRYKDRIQPDYSTNHILGWLEM